MTFADSIIQLRSELRISQKEQLNISVATVNRWENGRTEPNKMTLFVIRDFCKSKNIAFAFDTSKSVERGEQN